MGEREILYRGKRVDNGEWVKGDLSRCVVVGQTHICRIEDNFSTTTHRIDPETVCEYTGLTDKNGRKIFEGDIVKVTDSDRENRVFGIGDISFKEGSWKLCGEILYWLDDVISFEFEVIGNIFDNPELLELRR